LSAEEYSMRTYLASLVLGVAVGVVYGFVKVRSPAPPAIALLGLLGMLAGEQAISLARSYLFKGDIQLARHAIAVERGGLTPIVLKETNNASDATYPDPMPR
jgi:XapX domain-containing protein